MAIFTIKVTAKLRNTSWRSAAITLRTALPITIAAVMERIVTLAGPSACVISGGNVEWDGLRELFANG